VKYCSFRRELHEKSFGEEKLDNNTNYACIFFVFYLIYCQYGVVKFSNSEIPLSMIIPKRNVKIEYLCMHIQPTIFIKKM